MLEGGCFCGLVRYQTDGAPFHQMVCHCANCRGTAGAPMVGWVTVPKASFSLTVGEPQRFESSNHATRSFCPSCGTQLFFEDHNLPDEIDITIVSLDDPNAMKPKDHCYVKGKLDWVVLCDGLPQYPRGRNQG